MKIKYDGVDLNEQFECFVVDRPLPEFRASGSTVNGVDGDIFESATYGTREIVLALYAIDKTQRGLQRAARKVMELVGTHEEKKLVVGDERDYDGNQLYRKAVPIGVPEFTPYVHAGRFVIRFKQFDPFLYGKERAEQLMSLNQWHPFNTGGNVEAYPVIIAKPISNVLTVEKFGGEHITFKGDIAGKTVTINTKKQTVKVEPEITTGEGLQLGSRFFSIKDGVAIRANCTAVVSWDERWL